LWALNYDKEKAVRRGDVKVLVRKAAGFAVMCCTWLPNLCRYTAPCCRAVTFENFDSRCFVSDRSRRERGRQGRFQVRDEMALATPSRGVRKGTRHRAPSSSPCIHFRNTLNVACRRTVIGVSPWVCLHSTAYHDESSHYKVSRRIGEAYVLFASLNDYLHLICSQQTFPSLHDLWYMLIPTG
jgi:hypothetical protein